VDPLTHSLTGTALSHAGLRRWTPLATATLIVGANAPDLDIVSQLWDPWTALAWRRGITHGIPALLLLPFLVTAGILAWDRWVRRRRSPLAPPAQPRAVLGLAALGVWTHSPLDWINNYGMRWFLPFDGGWSYGDAIFILDPWIWLLLGGSAFLLRPRTRSAAWGWGVLAFALSALVLLAPPVPSLARLLWGVGVIAVLWLDRRPRPSDSPRVPRFALGIALVYILGMVALDSPQRRAVVAAAQAEGWTPESVMVAPVPANPMEGQVIALGAEGYRTGTFHWLRVPRVQFDSASIPRLDREDPKVAQALADPAVQRYLIWSRFPIARLAPQDVGWEIRFLDVRYLGREGDALAGPRLLLP
jgi:inner membrane protein